MLDKLVKVTTGEKKFYVGHLAGVDFNTLTLSLVDAKDQDGHKVMKILIHGNTWESITMEQEPFPLESLYKRIAATFPPGQVKIEEGVISILNGKIRVTEEGVEGSGPTTKHVQHVYDQFMAEYRDSQE
ncbi:MAG: Lsm family RNA-binding protein [Promethearchaeota archaeon]